MWQALIMYRTGNRVTWPSICLLALCMLWSHHAAAWGSLGHRVTGYVAEALLTDAARKQVRTLLGEESLATAATYMDSQRMALSERWPASDQWHYDNQPVCKTQAAYCADGNCATRQIERFRKVLADKRASQSERALALRLLVHLLGDIHQPLHMADNADRGGNNLYVRLHAGGQRYRLHEVMDTVLLKEIIGAQRTRNYADAMRQRYQAQLPAWQRGNVQEWAEQAHQLAVKDSYGALPGFACNTEPPTLTLPDAYVQRARQYLPEQLVKAGVRIAATLNAVLN